MAKSCRDWHTRSFVPLIHHNTTQFLRMLVVISSFHLVIQALWDQLPCRFVQLSTSHRNNKSLEKTTDFTTPETGTAKDYLQENEVSFWKEEHGHDSRVR